MESNQRVILNVALASLVKVIVSECQCDGDVQACKQQILVECTCSCT